MASEIYYIIAPGIINSEVPPQTTNILALQIAMTNEALAKTFEIATIVSLTNTFCLFIDIENEITVKEADDIISFFFFPNYHGQFGNPQVFLNCNNVELFDKSREVLIQVAKTQGFESIKCDRIQMNSKILNEIFSSNDLEKIKNRYQSLLYSYDSLLEKMFIELHSLSDIILLDEAFKKEEEVLKKNNQPLYLIKQQNQELREKVLQTEEILKAAINEIEIKDAHIEILRAHSQATHLQNYYTNEYEILPLWYKRFGHLLKVISGKRSFRSLFTDKEKKYKQ